MSFLLYFKNKHRSSGCCYCARLLVYNHYKQSKIEEKLTMFFNSTLVSNDVVILGSSRANNHFVSDLFENKA
jgi:hypothetical protein